MSTKITLATRKPIVRALGLGGRIKREMAQPLYVLNGQLVAHMKRKFRAVRIIDANTVECDLLAPALAEMPANFGRLDVNDAIVALGGSTFTVATSAKPKAGKASKPAKAAPSKGADNLAGVIAAIMASDATDADKNAAIKALIA